MKYKIIIPGILLICTIAVTGFINTDKKGWIKTIGKITDITVLDDGTYAYTIIYDADMSVTRNSKSGPKIELISQHCQ